MSASWGWIGDGIEQLYGTRNMVVALDTETGGLDFYHDILGVSLAWRDRNGNMKSAYLFAPVGQMSMDAPMDSIGELDIAPFLIRICDNHEIVFFNEAFDTRALFKIDREIIPRWTHDVMHIAGLLDAQEERSLEWLYRKYMGTTTKTEREGMKKRRKDLWKLPLAVVAPYAREDAVDTLELFERLYNKLFKKIGETLYERDRAYALIVMELIREGLKLDFRWCQEKEHEFVNRMLEIEQNLRLLGLKNINSNHKVAGFIFKTMELPARSLTRQANVTFPMGVPSVAADILEDLAEDSPEVAEILEHRQLNGAIGKYLRTYRDHARVDGSVHSLLDPFGTVTSRIAASHPNVTAIAMEDRGTAFGSMLGMFVADSPKEELWSLDFSQMEVRIAAAKAQENRMLGALNSGRDPYIEMSLQIWANNTRRTDAKHATLASLYEVGPTTFADEYKVHEDDAREIIYTFRRTYPKIKLASNLAMSEVQRTGCVTSYAGRPRWFGEWEEDYKAFNQDVQMAVAEIIRDAMLGLSDAYSGKMKLQVHDSLIVSLPRNQRQRSTLLREMTELMADAVPRQFSEVVDFPIKSARWQIKGAKS